MRKIIFLISIIITAASISNAQVQIDHPLLLTGTGANAKLSGIQNVTGNSDAVNADIIQKDSLTFASDTSTVAGIYKVPLQPAKTAYTTGMVLQFTAASASTGAATLSVNGLTPVTILKNYNNAIAANDIRAGQIVSVIYDGANFQMLSQIANVVSGSKFGGTGTDGALSISSGTTTLNLGGAAIFTKNYSSISITGTGQLNFSNPNASGTLIILLSQGNVTITSSASPAIDASGMGASAGNSFSGIDGASHSGSTGSNGASGAAGTKDASSGLYTQSSNSLWYKTVRIAPGSGGAGGTNGNPGGCSCCGGGSGGGSGGAGGGALYIEALGALNFTGSISVAGLNGSNGGGGNSYTGGGGGGGAGGTLLLLYNSLTANTGTVTVSGGNGGNGGNNSNSCSTSGGGPYSGGGGGGGGGPVNAGGAGGAQGGGGSAGSGTNAGSGGSVNGGGGGGGGGASGYSVVTQNLWF